MNTTVVSATTAVVLAAACASCAGDSTVPVCKPGDFIYTGRPTRTLFSYEEDCRADCFSEKSDCKQQCDDAIHPAAARGLLFGDRTLRLIDDESLGHDRALVFDFGFVDVSGTGAPANWGMSTQGPRTYLSGTQEGLAEFAMQAAVVSTDLLDAEDPLASMPDSVGLVPRDVGRLEITSDAGADRLTGRFFLGWGVATEQPQGEVIGCFDLGLGAARDVGGLAVQDLTP